MARRLLQHLASLTSHRDAILLDHNLIESLQSLLGAKKIALYDIVREADMWLTAVSIWGDSHGHRRPELTEQDYLPLERYPEIADCVARAAARVHQHNHYIPILVDGGIVACCEISYEKPPSRYKQEVASGIVNLYRNYLSLLEDCQTDTLTGLANRKTFELSIAHFLNRDKTVRNAYDEGEKNWLVIIDVDHFKQLNDKFGHLHGDQILKQMGCLMRHSFRQYDQIFRFGGDEFAVLLSRIDYRSACETLERLQQRIANQAQLGSITISIGFSLMRPEETHSAILERADEALYQAKALGRNQLCCFETLAAQ